MNCSAVADRLQQLSPESSSIEVARLTTLILASVEDESELQCAETLQQIMQDVHLRLQASNDQHAAMTHELEELTQSDPRQFTPDQIWVLIRSIKVQSQVLKLWIGDPAYELE